MTSYVRLATVEGMSFEAATLNETRWNGWERPGFTREQADTVVAWLNRRAHQGFPFTTYDATTGAYSVTEESGEVSVCTASSDGTFALGGAAWCWEECPPARDRAVLEFVDVWAHSGILATLGPALTCKEAETLANLLRAEDFGEQARMLIKHHASADDDPDLYDH